MQIPANGERIPIEKFHVSRLNVRVDEPFGVTKDDEILIVQVKLGGKIVGPFKARPEGDGYGVFVGRRRFLAKKEAGAKYFVVGSDVIVEDVDEEKARRESLIENLDILRTDMNPIARAKALNQVVTDAGGLRAAGEQLGLSFSTLSEWLKVLELSRKTQKAVGNGILNYTDALELARSQIDHSTQDALQEVLERDGHAAFKKEVERIAYGKMKRGLPKGKYVVLRAAFDKNRQNEMEVFQKLEEMAKLKRMRVDEFCKWILTEYIRKTE